MGCLDKVFEWDECEVDDIGVDCFAGEIRYIECAGKDIGRGDSRRRPG